MDFDYTGTVLVNLGLTAVLVLIAFVIVSGPKSDRRNATEYV
jgi:hypothetical protein